ncbi:MAG: AAA family ATPase [Chloroflexi bacterium]|nr:AAA family ATPase [Chloroflexota bacterium]
MTTFKTLEVADWRQFGSVQIELHPRATVITGANGAGKTTLLSILSQHFGWVPAFIGTLRIDRRGAQRYFSGVTRDIDDSSNGYVNVGSLTYGNGTIALLQAPTEGASFNVEINGLQIVPGVYITSHRPVYSYQMVTEIPTRVQASSQLFSQYLDNLRQFYQPGARIQSPSHRLKAALISLAMFGYGNQVVAPNDDARMTFEGFSEVLSRVLPADLDFRRIAIRMPEVILETGTGDFSLDASSGGIAALVDVAWQIYMQSRSDAAFTVLMDEPENHLHPSLQRSVLPGLLTAFPQAQFIVATHNPFVVTSVKDSNVIVLEFIDGRVASTKLEDIDRSATANKILTDVLGVPFPVPLWVEDEVEKIVNSVRDEDLNGELLTRLKTQLNSIGLGDLFPEVIDRLLPADGAD